MSSMSLDAVLNIASAAITTIVILVSARRDLIRLFVFLYAILLVILLVVPSGGQVNAALALVLVFFEILELMAPAKSRIGGVVESTQAVRVFDGFMNLGTQRNMIYNTFDPTASTYTPMPRSVNRAGGAQFTYRFWLKIGASKRDDDLMNKTLLIRGDTGKYNLASTTCTDYQAMAGEGKAGQYLVMCPRIYFTSAKTIAVAVNTDTKLLTTFDCGNNTSDPARSKNMLTMLYGKYAMMTFVFEDNVDITEFEKGVRMSMYVNDSLYVTKTSPGALRQNNGNLYVAPEEMADRYLNDVYMADLTYYNYALSDIEVRGLFMLGHSNKESRGTTTANGDLVLSAYNPIDRYNTDWQTAVR